MKKRVLIGINNLYANSIGISLINLLNSIDTTKYEVDLIFIRSQANVLNQIPKVINVIFSPFQKKSVGLLDKIKMFKKYDFSLMYDLGNEDLANLIRFASRNNALYIHKNYRQVYVVPQQYEEFAEKMKLLKFNKYLFSTQALLDSFANYYPDYVSRLSVLEYIINDKYILNMSKAHIEVDKPNHKVLFVSVGTLNDRSKNFSLMIKMMADLVRVNNRVHLWIIGDGPDLVKIKMLVTQMNLTEYVTLFGFKTNPYPYMQLADYIVNTSDTFDSSMALIEARVLEKPIITTNIDTVTDNTYIVSADPNKIAMDVNDILQRKVVYNSTNNFWAENQHLLKTLYYIIDKK